MGMEMESRGWGGDTVYGDEVGMRMEVMGMGIKSR